MIACNCEVCLSDNPKDKRLRSSALLSIKHKNILIDCGPDIRKQLLSNNILDIDFVLLTHEHNDHVIGLDDLRPICYLNNKCIPILAEQRVIDSVIQRFPYLFKKNRFGSQAFEAVPIAPGKHHYNSIHFEAIRVDHGGLEILSFRFDKLAYITDAKRISPENLARMLDLEILIINSLQIDEHYKHFNLRETLAVINQLKPTQTYLTHISHRLGLHEEIKLKLPPNILLAHDNLNLSL